MVTMLSVPWQSKVVRKEVRSRTFTGTIALVNLMLFLTNVTDSIVTESETLVIILARNATKVLIFVQRNLNLMSVMKCLSKVDLGKFPPFTTYQNHVQGYKRKYNFFFS